MQLNNTFAKPVFFIAYKQMIRQIYCNVLQDKLTRSTTTKIN